MYPGRAITIINRIQKIINFKMLKVSDTKVNFLKNIQNFRSRDTLQ